MSTNIQYSFIVPVFNRPNEVKELLESLVLQSLKDFEVVIIEDGSTEKSDEVVQAFSDQLTISHPCDATQSG